MRSLRAIPLLAVLACGLGTPPHARAAEGYDNCTGFIDAVPATITTQGTWCLRKDLATALSSGAAVRIDTNNVTVDCNGFKLGGLAAGIASTAHGIRAENRQNVGIRNCSIRGFHYGVYVYGGAGHVIEDNRFDGNLVAGISTFLADGSQIRGNRVQDTGGFQDNALRYGIYVYGGDAAEVIDNTVSGVYGTQGYYNDVVGIARVNYISGVDRTSGYFARNRVSGLAPTGAGKYAFGFRNINAGGTDSLNLVEDNYFAMAIPVTGSVGIQCIYAGNSVRGNTVLGFPTGLGAACLDDGTNEVH